MQETSAGGITAPHAHIYLKTSPLQSWPVTTNTAVRGQFCFAAQKYILHEKGRPWNLIYTCGGSAGIVLLAEAKIQQTSGRMVECSLDVHTFFFKCLDCMNAGQIMYT